MIKAIREFKKQHSDAEIRVVYDKQSEELCVCTDNYSDDIHASTWKLLREVFK